MWHMTLEMRMIRRAYSWADRSPDTSSQNGAIITTKDGLSVGGCNAFPLGVEWRLERPEKYLYIEHAERNAIFSAAKLGYRLDGATMFCPWAACADCARAIVCSGITKLVRHQESMDRTPDSWLESCAAGETILQEGNVEIVNITGKAFNHGERLYLGVDFDGILRNGERWVP